VARYAPKDFPVGSMTFYNGQAVRSSHAVELDRYATWLAATYRPNIPAVIGHALTNAAPYHLRTTLPHYTETAALGFLVTGKGDITVENSDDSYNAKAEVDTASSSDVITEAEWWWYTVPLPSVSSNGLARAMDITSQSAGHLVTFEFTVSSGLHVYHAVILAYPRTQDSVLEA